MKGPSDISDILSRMKSKKVDVNNKRNSKVSVKDLKQMSNIKVPKSSKKEAVEIQSVWNYNYNQNIIII